MKCKSIILAGLMFFCPFLIIAQNLTLPFYHLNIDPVYLDSLEANPSSPLTYPAILEYEDEIYPCEVNYRGTSGLTLPKKSWNIYFEDEGPGGSAETNLNSEYRDISLCRNYLSMELARECGLDAPDMRFISFLINDAYQGVYLEVEEVDDEFLENRDLDHGCMFKAITNGARFAPPQEPQALLWYYEPSITEIGGIDTLGARLAYIQYADYMHIAETIDQVFDVESFIKFFAVGYCVASTDGFTKNFYFYEDCDNRYSIIPWDSDCTFGNDYNGVYVGGEDELTYLQLNHQAIFQRIISVDEYRNEFHAVVEDIVNNEYEDIVEELEEVYDEIRNDVYQDTLKLATNDEFDQELAVIENFILLRAQALTNLDWFHRIDLESYAAIPDYIASLTDTVHFRAVPEVPCHSMQLVLNDLEGNSFYQYFYDDGITGDSIAGDGIYSLNLVMENLIPPVRYSFKVRYNVCEGYPTPPSGWINSLTFPLSRPVIRLDNNPPQAGDFQFGAFYYNQIMGLHYFSLINQANSAKNLSGCFVRLGNAHELMQIGEVPAVLPGDSLIITNNFEIVSAMFSSQNIAGNFYFLPETGDTVNLMTSSKIVLATSAVTEVLPFEEYIGPVVINEINYHSTEDFNPEDWLELYAPYDDVNLTGWVLKDSRQNHYYYFPGGYVLHTGEYLVVAEDPEAFSQCFPNVDQMIGGFSFSFSGAGEEIRIFDGNSGLMDYVLYDDSAPWPEEPDGDGPTLELINPLLPNQGYLNWRASGDTDPHGTPGRTNSTFLDTNNGNPPNIPQNWKIVSIYPNPFNDRVIITFNAPQSGNAEFKIYNILGEEVISINETINQPGRYNIHWDGRSQSGFQVASGVYLLSFQNSLNMQTSKVLILK